MRRKTQFLLVACLLAISIMIGGCTNMQNQTAAVIEKYPNKPITIIVPFGVGGGSDMVARALEKTAPKYLGQPLVVVNKPGGAGTVGFNELAGAHPDGYTIGLASSELFLLPLYGPTKYNYPTALSPLAQITASPVVMAVQAKQPGQTIDDFISYVKQHPGEIKFGNSGVGSIPHVSGEIFAKAADIAIEQVPFQSASEAMTALLGGHIQVIFANPGVVKEYVKNGMVKILAVASDQRLTDPIFANVPTFKEQGLDVVYSNRLGIALPKETPIEVKTKLVEGLNAMITDPEFKKSIEIIGLQYEYLDSKKSEESWLTDNQRLSKAVQEIGILDSIKSQKQ